MGSAGQFLTGKRVYGNMQMEPTDYRYFMNILDLFVNL